MGPDHKLPEMEHHFHFQSEGKESKLNWVGDFTYRRPNILQRSKIDAFRAKLNGDQKTIAEAIDFTNAALAHLRFTLVKFPDWWRDSDFGGSLYDTNIIDGIYGECLKFEESWRKSVMSGDPRTVEVTHGESGTVGVGAGQ